MQELLFSLLVALASSQVGAPPSLERPDHAEACSKARAAQAPPRAGGPSVRLLAPPDDPLAALTDVEHYRLDLVIDPTAHRLTGTGTMTVRCVSAATAFRFRLDDLFTIGAVTVDGAGATWHRVDAETVEVSLGAPRAAGETFVLAVPYDGFPTSQYGSIVFTAHSFQPVVYTLSEPWYAYTWWPAKDDNRDKATADLLFTVPAAMSVASNGRLVEVAAAGGGRQRFHWRTEYETAPYLFSFAATNYSRVDSSAVISGVTMPVSLYIYPEHDIPVNRNQWLQAVDMLGVFGNVFGPYPFAAEKYGIYQWPVGGGMEHQTITGQGSFLEFLTAHELAHQWWGDLVTCATWHDIWLNEGFATYAEALWFERKQGSAGAGSLRQAMELREPTDVNGTVYCYDDSTAARIFSGTFTYRKASWVLHMLRRVVGEDAFFATLAAWRSEFAFSAATTADFRRVAEAVSGRDLERFFEQWVYQPGAPTYRYSWRPVTAAGGSYVELFLEQIQDASYPTFAMPVDVKATASGASEVVTGWNDERAEHLLLPVGRTATAVELDPDHWILREGRVASSFVAGPPKVVKVMPGSGAAVPPGGTTSVVVTFHDAVTVPDGAFALAGVRVGAVEFDVIHDTVQHSVTLVPRAPLALDSYTVTIADTVTSIAGLALDGETVAGALPSGDGLPGGDAVVTFTVARRPRPRLGAALTP